jgi:hypothetical protein
MVGTSTATKRHLKTLTLLCAKWARSDIVRVVGGAHPNATRDGEGTDDEA